MKLLSLTLPGGQTVQAPTGVPTGGFETDFAQGVIQRGITIFLIIVIVVALFSLIYSGIQWTSSGGDKQKLQTARNRLTYSIIGLIVALLAFFIISFVGGLFGVDLGVK